MAGQQHRPWEVFRPHRLRDSRQPMCEWFRLARSIARFVPSEVMPEAAHDRYDAVYAEPARHRHVPRHTDPTREVAVGPRCGAAGWRGGRRSRPHVATVCRVGIPDPDRVGLGCPRPRPRRIDIGLGPGGQVDHRHKPDRGRPKGRVGVRAGFEAVGFRLRVREPWWYARAEVAR